LCLENQHRIADLREDIVELKVRKEKESYEGIVGVPAQRQYRTAELRENVGSPATQGPREVIPGHESRTETAIQQCPRVSEMREDPAERSAGESLI